MINLFLEELKLRILLTVACISLKEMWEQFLVIKTASK